MHALASMMLSSDSCLNGSSCTSGLDCLLCELFTNLPKLSGRFRVIRCRAGRDWAAAVIIFAGDSLNLRRAGQKDACLSTLQAFQHSQDMHPCYSS